MPITRASLAPDLSVERVVTGLWQVSGTHGPINPMKAVAQMHDFHARGLRTWDVADHYGPAEDFVGTFLEELEEKHGAAEREKVTVLTKWVPTHPEKRAVADVDYTLAYVEKAIDRSLKRLRVECLDLLQFHWWDYADRRVFAAFAALQKLVAKGKIRRLAVTNFDGKNLEVLLKEGLPIVSNQVRFSLLDRRAERDLIPVCEKYGVKLLAFGTLGGGWIAERHIGQPDPTAGVPFAQRHRYHQIIGSFGGWNLLQKLLVVLRDIAREKGVPLSAVASRYVLDRPQVAAVIVGARLGESDHIVDTAAIDRASLTDGDRAKIEAVLDQGRHFSDVMGEVASEYRTRTWTEMPAVE